MCLVQIKQAQIKFPLSGFWTVYGSTVGCFLILYSLQNVQYTVLKTEIVIDQNKAGSLARVTG
jgi:hypothetical protein